MGYFKILFGFFLLFYLYKTFFKNSQKKIFFNQLHGNSLIELNPEFEKIYKKIKNSTYISEVERYKTITENSIWIGFLIFLELFILISSVEENNLLLFIILFIFFLIYLIIFPTSLYSKYKKLYKTTIILPLVENISSTLKYTYDDASPTEKAYKASNLETSFFNKYISDDYMYGSIKGYNFNLSNIHTQHIISSDIGKSITHLFNGIFIYSYTQTNSNYEFKIFNKKLRTVQSNLEVIFPDERFSKHFRLFAENEDVIISIFSKELLDLLDNFMTTYGIPFDLSVTKNAFYFRFYTGTSFEIPLFKKSNYLYLLNSYYSIIDFVIKFISTFQKYN